VGKVKTILHQRKGLVATVAWLVPSQQTNQAMNSTTARLFLNTAPEDTVLINTEHTQNSAYPIHKLYRINHALQRAGVHSTNIDAKLLRKEIVEEDAYYDTAYKVHSIKLPYRGREGGRLHQMEVLVVPTALLDQLFQEALLLTTSRKGSGWTALLLNALQGIHHHAAQHEQALKSILGAALLRTSVNRALIHRAWHLARDARAWIEEQQATRLSQEEVSPEAAGTGG